MTVTLPEVPAAEDAAAWDADLTHLFCCDEDISMCGTDLAGVPVVDSGDDERLCPLCELVRAEGAPCPVPGCKGRRPVDH